MLTVRSAGGAADRGWFSGSAHFPKIREFKDVVFEDVVFDNNRFSLILYLDFT